MNLENLWAGWRSEYIAEATARAVRVFSSQELVTKQLIDATGAGDALIAGALATLVAARALPGSPSWSAPEVWRTALRAR